MMPTTKELACNRNSATNDIADNIAQQQAQKQAYEVARNEAFGLTSRTSKKAVWPVQTPLLNILVIDDDLDILKLTKSILSDGLTTTHVRTATSLKDAEKIIRLVEPDVIILDIDLPDGNGLTMLRETYDGNPPWPVIILSGCQDFVAPFKSMVSGAVNFLDKSTYSFSNLPQSVLNALHEYRYDV